MTKPIYRNVCLLLVFLSALPGLAQKSRPTKAPLPTAPATAVPPRLTQELQRLSDLSGGKVGFWATHLESGRTVAQNGQEPFPMASSYKVAIATQLLSRVDSNQLTLDQLIPLTNNDLHPGSGMLSDRFSWSTLR